MRSHKEILYLTNNQEDRQLMNYEIIKIDIQKELSKQIELLPPQCGQVFKLMYYQGKNSTQVAQEMGITRKTVLNQKLKAQRLIREALEKKSPCGGRG